MQGPNLKTPEAVEFWKPVLEQVKTRLEKRGLGSAMMIGMANDSIPAKEEVATFSACLPGIKWVQSAHPDYRGGNIRGVPIGYNTAVYLRLFPPPPPWDAKRPSGWRLAAKSDAFPRSGCYTAGDRLVVGSPLAEHRVFNEACLMSDWSMSGLGRSGVDFWPVLGSGVIRRGFKNSMSINARYMESCWDQLNMDRATEHLFAPGPDGAADTECFETLREGVQDCEARIFIEKAIYDGKLDPALSKKCQEILDGRQWIIRAACMGAWGWFEGAGSAGLSEKLYACAAEVAKALGK
jgi:hypothetical protein